MSRHRPNAPAPRRGEDWYPLVDAKTVLVVASDHGRAGELVGELQARGMPAVMGTEPNWVFHWMKQVPPALIVMDMNARGAVILMHELRRQGRHIVALSDDPAARESALESGCLEAHHRSDPAHELATHVATLLRTRKVRRVGRIAAGPLVVDLTEHRLHLERREVRVSPLLLDLAAYLAARAGRVVSPRTLLEEVWGEPWADIGKVHVAVLRLRRALELPTNSEFLVGRQRHGYGLFPDALLIRRSRSPGVT